MSKKTFVIETVLFFILLFVFGGPVGSIFGSHINVIDEGQFGAWAYHMLHGKKLFVDIYTTYGPLYSYPLVFLFSIFGSDPFLVRLYLLIGSFAGGLMCLYLGYVMGLSKLSRFFLILFFSLLPIITVRQGLGILSLTLCVLSIQSKNNFLGFLSGVSLIFAFLISPEIAIFVALTQLVFFIILLLNRKNIRILFLSLLYYISGALVIILPFVIFSSINGWFTEYVRSTIDVFMSFSGANVPNGMNFPSIEYVLFGHQSVFEFVKSISSVHGILYWVLVIYLITLVYLFYKWIANMWHTQDTWIFLLSLFGILLYSVVLSRPGVGHVYFILPPLILILLVFAQKLVLLIHHANSQERIVALILFCLISVFLFRLCMIQRVEMYESFSDLSTYGQRESIPGYSTFFKIDNTQLSHINLTTSLIDSYTETSDSVFFLSDNPMAYLLAKKENPTRYDLPYIANSRKKRFEILSDIETKKPVLILYDTTAWEVDGISNKERLPEVFEYVLSHYSLVTVKSGIEVYKLKN